MCHALKRSETLQNWISETLQNWRANITPPETLQNHNLSITAYRKLTNNQLLTTRLNFLLHGRRKIFPQPPHGGQTPSRP